jgi:RHS repeat-associated protein
LIDFYLKVTSPPKNQTNQKHGSFEGSDGKTATYTLSMAYDNMHNIISKKQDMTQTNLQFAGSLYAGYDLKYDYADNSQQIRNIADSSYRRADNDSIAPVIVKRNYSYDANGNLTYIATGKQLNGDSSALQATGIRKLLWDEENRLLAINDNGFVSNYWYDADGERAVKMSAENEGVFVNGVQVAGKMSNAKFTAYISPYMVVNSGGWYSKHIYMGSQRIASKLGNSGIFTNRNPLTDTTAYEKNYVPKLESLTKGIKTRYDSLGVEYPGTPSTAGLVNSSPGNTTQSYFYHSDHLGSSSVITDQLGALVQHVEYVPFGEVFVEERASTSSWRTPYLFNAKELDEETGLYYYGARYYDPRTSVWLSVDPLAEKYPNVGSYVYCVNNPVKFVDPDGREKIIALNSEKDKTIISGAQNYKDDNSIHVFAHGSSRGMSVVVGGKTTTIRTAGQMEEFLSENSETWQNKGEGDQVTLVLHSCRTGQDNPDGSESFAEKISESGEFKDVTVIAPDQRDYFSEDGEIGIYEAKYADGNGEYKRDGNGNVKNKERSDKVGSWRVFKNGKQTGSYSGDWKPKENPTLWDKLTKKED